MKAVLSPRAIEALENAPPAVQKAFYKQIRFLEENPRHPSLRAKKFDASGTFWQARVDRSWRFYFAVVDDVYRILDVIPHPK